jgi:hypothetical protein
VVDQHRRRALQPIDADGRVGKTIGDKAARWDAISA